MKPSLCLYDTETAQVRDYPRADDEPVVGLDPRYVVLQIVRDPAPEYDASTQRLIETRTVDLDAGEWKWGWAIEDLPPPPAPGPDYGGFYGGLLAGQVYGTVVATPGKSGDQAAAMTVFLGAIQDALSGRENRPAFQQAIWFLLGQLQPARLDLRQVEYVVDHAEQQLAGFPDHAQPFTLAVIELAARHDVGHRQHAVIRKTTIHRAKQRRTPDIDVHGR
jgi:hypothetical protein